MRLGIAHAAAELWREPKYREAATEALVRLMPMANKAIAKAILGIFRTTDHLQYDSCTQSILGSLCDHPEVIRLCPHSFLDERIQDLFPAHASLVARVANVIVSTAEERGAEGLIDTWRLGKLVDVALSLHRLDETREHGLDLFERLLGLEAHGVRDALRELDARPANAAR